MKFLSPSSGYTPWLILCLVLILIVTGFNYLFKPFAPSPTVENQKTAITNATPSAAPDPFAQLTNQQKIAQLMIAPLVITDSTVSGQTKVDQTAWEFIQSQHPGGVILFGQNISADTVASISASLTKKNQPLTWLAVDHEGGDVQRLLGEGFTPLMAWQKLCRMSDDDRQSALTISAQELADAGINMVLAPVVDVASRSSVLKDRVCSGDGAVVSAASRQAVMAYQAVGILPVIKHFPGIGSLLVDLHTKFSVVNPQNIDGMPFQLLLSEFPSLAVMTTFTGVSGVCENEPCALNRTCLSALTSRYPKSLLITDALDMTSAGFNASSSGSLSLTDRSAQAVRAGNHLLLYGKGVTVVDLARVIEVLSQLYKTDDLFRQQVDLALTQASDYRQLLLTPNAGLKGSR